MPEWCQWKNEDLILLVRVHPRAGRDEVVGETHGRLKVRIAAPPVDGGANERLRTLLARELGVARSRVRLLSGVRSRDKRVAITEPRATPRWLRPAGVSS